MPVKEQPKRYELGENMTFGEAVKEIALYRIRFKTLKEAADAIGMTVQQLSTITKDRQREAKSGKLTQFDRDTIIRIAEGLGWDLGQALEYGFALNRTPSVTYVTPKASYALDASGEWSDRDDDAVARIESELLRLQQEVKNLKDQQKK